MNKQSAIEVAQYSAVAVGLCVIVGVLLLYKLGLRKTEKTLRQWAGDNQLEILHFERCFLAGGFALFTTSRNQTVYFVRVRDSAHRERSGWVRCDGLWGGDGAEVKWKSDR